MGFDTVQLCDLDGSGRCDLEDRYVLQLMGGACLGDDTYYPVADADYDGCITEADENHLFQVNYTSVDPHTQASLRETVHEVIDDHLRFPYTSEGMDAWDILELADEDPMVSTTIIDLYKNATYPKAGGGNDFYQREHTWPNSYGFRTMRLPGGAWGIGDLRQQGRLRPSPSGWMLARTASARIRAHSGF